MAKSFMHCHKFKSLKNKEKRMKFENVHEVAMNVDICRRFIDFQERGCIERPCLFPSITYTYFILP